MECVLGVPFGYEPNEELRKLLEDFRDMVNFCIDYAYRRRITSYAKLRKGVYEDDRDVTACINMLRMRGVPFPLKATYEPIVVRLKG